MAEESGFYSDDTYSQAEFAEFTRRIFRDGYCFGEGDELEVIQHDPAAMTVIVGTGKALIQGYWHKNTAALELTIEAADATNPRIDRIVLRCDFVGAPGSIVAAVLKGTPAAVPVAPTLTQDTTFADIWEISLAQVYVGALETAVHTADITNERDTAYCGVVGPRYIGKYGVNDDGTLSQEATTALKGTVKLANHLGGTAALPTVIGMQEAGGPTSLITGAVADGSFLKRSGATLIGDDPYPGVYSRTARATVANTTVETQVCVYTIPAGTMVIGSTFRLTALCNVGTKGTGPGTLTFAVKVGGTAVATAVTGTLNSGASDQGLEIEAYVTFRTIGPTGTCIGAIWTHVDDVNFNGSQDADTATSTTAVNTNIDRDIEITVKWSVADASNSLLCELATVELVKLA